MPTAVAPRCRIRNPTYKVIIAWTHRGVMKVAGSRTQGVLANPRKPNGHRIAMRMTQSCVLATILCHVQ